MEWETVKTSIIPGMIVQGTVVRHETFGFFVQFEEHLFLGLVEIVNIRDHPPVIPSVHYPAVGSSISEKVLDLTDHNQQIRLTLLFD